MPDPHAPPPWGPPWLRGVEDWETTGPPPFLRPVLAVFVALVQVLGTVGAAHGQPDRRPLDVIAVALLLVAPVAIALVRRIPRAAMVATAAAVAVFLLLGYPYGPVFLGLAVLLVLTVVRGRRWLAWASAAAVVAAEVVARLVLDRAPWSWQGFGGFLAWALVILSVAEVARSWRERAVTRRAAALETRRRQAGEERLRIAQELHDVVAHHMSLINVQAGVALHLAERKPENVEPALRAIKDASKEALTELRSLIGVLRADGPAPRTPAPTLQALDDIVERASHAGLAVTKTVEGQAYPLPTAVELAAYRIVQEAITNVVRHSGARRATVTLGYGANVLTVEVGDDGRGAADPVPGNGLRGMRERAEALGGTLEVGRSDLGGLSVTARLPVEGEGAE